jgi:hypothetical protein
VPNRLIEGDKRLEMWLLRLYGLDPGEVDAWLLYTAERRIFRVSGGGGT